MLSLLDSFDADMAARIAGLPSEMVAIRLTHRTFVDLDERAPFPYAIHRLLRQEVRLTDAGPDAFSADDWARYARRAFDELGARYREASGTGDRATVISALNQALRLADEFRVDPGWCVDTAYSFIGDSLWESSLRPLVATPATTPAAALARTLLAIVDRQADRRESARVLGEVLDSGLLTGDVRDLAVYYRAETLRETGHGDESETLVNARRPRDPGDGARRQGPAPPAAPAREIHREARDLIAARPPAPLWRQMAGTLYWTQGMLVEATAEYVAARDMFREQDRPGHAAEVEGCLAYVAGLRGADERDREQVSAGLTALRRSRNTWARLMSQLGAVFLTADGGATTGRELTALDGHGEAAGLTSIQAYARFGACLNAALSGDGGRLRAARTDLAGWVAHGDFRWLVEIVDFWIDPPLVDAAQFWTRRPLNRLPSRQMLIIDMPQSSAGSSIVVVSQSITHRSPDGPTTMLGPLKSPCSVVHAPRRASSTGGKKPSSRRSRRRIHPAWSWSGNSSSMTRCAGPSRRVPTGMSSPVGSTPWIRPSSRAAAGTSSSGTTS